jgi:hypothetical protein
MSGHRFTLLKLAQPRFTSYPRGFTAYEANHSFNPQNPPTACNIDRPMASI